MSRHRLCAFASAAMIWTVAPVAVEPETAFAGSFTVTACDAAPGGAHSSWIPQAGSIDTYKICPSSNLPGFGGMGTRLAGRTFSNGQYSRLWFYAPSGTTITGLTWSGAWTTSCSGGSWANQLRAQGGVDTLLTGHTPGGCGSADRAPFYTATPPGTVRLLQNTQCGSSTCSSAGAAFRTRYAAVILNDPSPPSLGITGGGLSGRAGWVRGNQALSVSQSDNTGVKLVRVQIAGGTTANSVKPCNYTLPAPCAAGNGASSLTLATTALPDGPRTVTATAYDAAGNATSRSATAKLDNNAPAAPDPVGDPSWRRSNAHSLRWSSPESAAATRAPLTRVRYRICPAGSQASCAPERSVNGSFLTALSAIPVPGPGQWDVRVALVDSAGNGSGTDAHWSGPLRLRYDPEAPSLRIEAQDPADPIGVTVRAVDPVSGVAGGEIEVRRAGSNTWTELPTRLDGARLRAELDDERLPDGAYQLRARARDRAGNEASTGANASRTLPVRIATRLRAGLPRVRHVRVRGKRRRVVRLIKTKRVRYGKRFEVRGSLSTRDGQPLEDTAVTVFARPNRLGGTEAIVGLIRTDRDGRFRYRARARESRVLRFRYRGSRRVRGSDARVRMLVRARVALRIGPVDVVNGETVRFRGRVSGQIPVGGKELVIQARSRGKWRLVTLVRTNARGRYSASYRFDGTRGKVIYPLRALATKEPAFAYEPGASRITRVTVRGL